MNTATVPPPFADAVLAEDDPRSAANIERRKAGKLTERDQAGRLYPGSCLPGAGRTPGHTLQFIARQYTGEAIVCLAEIMADPKAPHAARVTAAGSLLDRAWGRASISVDLNARSNFADFIHEMGVQARTEHDHPAEVTETEG
jgi:hypothetical protein